MNELWVIFGEGRELKLKDQGLGKRHYDEGRLGYDCIYMCVFIEILE